MLDKKAKIIELLLDYPKGLKAREISKKLPYIDKKEVNQILYSNPSDFTSNDYVWKLIEPRAIKISEDLEYKKKEIDLLNKEYNTPYLETKKLIDLEISKFKLAVKHAKELSDNYLSYYISEKWIDFVSLPDDIFQLKKNAYITKRENERVSAREKTKKLLEDARKQRLADEKKIRHLCDVNDLSYEIYEKLISMCISANEIEQRLNKILYYEKNHPETEISVSNCITMTVTEFDDYIKKKTTKPTRVCYGDCSSCRREVCLMGKI